MTNKPPKKYAIRRPAVWTLEYCIADALLVQSRINKISIGNTTRIIMNPVMVFAVLLILSQVDRRLSPQALPVETATSGFQGL